MPWKKAYTRSTLTVVVKLAVADGGEGTIEALAVTPQEMPLEQAMQPDVAMENIKEKARILK